MRSTRSGSGTRVGSKAVTVVRSGGAEDRAVVTVGDGGADAIGVGSGAGAGAGADACAGALGQDH